MARPKGSGTGHLKMNTSTMNESVDRFWRQYKTEKKSDFFTRIIKNSPEYILWLEAVEIDEVEDIK